MSGTAFAAGDRVLVCFGAANHDPAVFDRPEEFDPARKQNARHLAFGYGRHRCIGEHLARLELDIFLEEFLRRIPDYRLVPGTRIEMKHATVRGPKRFEICWDPR
jgi:cytochrome P450